MSRDKEIEKAANDFFPIDEKEMSLDEQSDQLLRQIGFKFGAKWQYEQFEKNRLTACDNMTKEEAEREQEFTTDFIEKNNRVPTYSDAIEYGRKIAFDKAVEWMKLYILNHEYVDIFEMEAAFKNELMEE